MDLDLTPILTWIYDNATLIGLVASLIAIFAFVTGKASIPDILAAMHRAIVSLGRLPGRLSRRKKPSPTPPASGTISTAEQPVNPALERGKEQPVSQPMSPIANLEAEIRKFYDRIHRFERKLGLSSDPLQQDNFRDNIKDQRELVKERLEEYRSLCQTTNHTIPEDIHQIAIMMKVDITAPKVTPSTSSVSSTPSSLPPHPNQVDKGKLRQVITQFYPKPDFELLCLNLDTRYDLLRGDTLQLKIAYLVEDVWDTPQYARLINQIITDKPHLKDRLIG